MSSCISFACQGPVYGDDPLSSTATNNQREESKWRGRAISCTLGWLLSIALCIKSIAMIAFGSFVLGTFLAILSFSAAVLFSVRSQQAANLADQWAFIKNFSDGCNACSNALK